MSLKKSWSLRKSSRKKSFLESRERLGLSIVNKPIEDFGTEVTVESAVAVGTEFIFTIAKADFI